MYNPVASTEWSSTLTGTASQPELIFIGPMPPPVHGQSVATESLRRILVEHSAGVKVFDSGPRETGGPVRRIASAVWACFGVFFAVRKTVYISVNAGRGVVITVIICAVARLRRHKIALHHHSYRYIGRRHLFMQMLAFVAGRKSLHIVNCRRMAEEIQNQYPIVELTQSYNNVGVVSANLIPTERNGKLAVGHLSNLTEAKGLARAINAFRAARKLRPDLTLHIAGPCAEPFAESQITSANKEFGDSFVYHGEVHGEQKKAFFDAIDIFLFPSLYPVETQGIVNLEALACGKPVVAFAQCCIPEDVGKGGGVAVPKGSDFSAAVITYLQKYLDDPETARENARKRFLEIQKVHEGERDSLLEYLNVRPLIPVNSI